MAKKATKESWAKRHPESHALKKRLRAVRVLGPCEERVIVEMNWEALHYIKIALRECAEGGYYHVLLKAIEKAEGKRG